MEILNKLYSMKNFGLYLIIAIIVLVILFIIIMVFGKKDKKKREIEATTKLQQLNSENAFKEENAISTVEVPNEVVMKNDTIVIPTLEAMTQVEQKEDNNVEEVVEPANMVIDKEEYTLDNQPNIVKEDVVIPIKDEVDLTNYVDDNTIATPVLNKVEEKPLVFEQTASVQLNEDTRDEAINEDHVEVEIPSFNQTEIPQTTPAISEVSDTINVPNQIEEEDAIELPALKKSDNEQDILERTKDIEPIKLDGYDINNISGETYTINK